MGPAWHLLEIDRDALQLIVSDKPHELLLQRVAAVLIGEQFGEARTVPLSHRRVLNGRKDRKIRPLGAHVREQRPVERADQIQIGSLQRQPGRHQPVDLGQRAHQGRVGRRFPIGIERDGERAAVPGFQHGRQHAAAQAALVALAASARQFLAPFASIVGQPRRRANKARRLGALFEVGDGDRRQMARKFQPQSVRHAEQAGHEHRAKHEADESGAPADDGRAKGTPAAGIEKDRLIGHGPTPPRETPKKGLSLSCSRRRNFSRRAGTV